MSDGEDGTQMYPSSVTCDFRKVSMGALKRYAALYRIHLKPNLSQEEVAIVVGKHFHQTDVADEDNVFSTFISRINGEEIRPTRAPDREIMSTEADREYCICKGRNTQGTMIACDNSSCLDISNWYHYSCVGLNEGDDVPTKWYVSLNRSTHFLSLF